jgi:hypothetical protein
MTPKQNVTRTQEIAETVIADKLYADSRTMVRESERRTSEAKRTVAMTAIRALESDNNNVAAIMPMILELYLRRDPAEIVKDAIETHAKDCSARKVFGRMSVAIFGAGGGAGLLGALIQWLVGRSGG